MLKLVIDNVNTRVVGAYDPNPVKAHEIHEALREELSYVVPNAEWSPSFKEGKWDGKISLYYRRHQSFPTGLTSRVSRLLRERGIDFTFSDQREKPTADYPVTCDFGNKELRFYQTAAGDVAAKYQRGVIAAATGAGKTMLSCYLLSKIGVKPVVFIVPAIELLRQTQREFEKYLRLDGKPIKVGMAGGGACDLNPEGINIITYQTALAAFDEKYQEKGNKIVATDNAGDKNRKTTKELEQELEVAEKALARAKSASERELAAKQQGVDRLHNAVVALEASEPPKSDKIAYREWKKELTENTKTLRAEEREYARAVKTLIQGPQETYNKALGAVQNRYRILEDKASIRSLIENCRAMIVDEAHVAAVVIECLGGHAAKAYYRIGLSVDASSYIELRGGPFGQGWVGCIEDAYNIVRKDPGSILSIESGHQVLRLVTDVVEGRGWMDNGGFGWKPVNAFIRHKNDRKSRIIHAGGDHLGLTDDHSVFRVEAANPITVHNKTKYLPDIVCRKADELHVGDILPLDNGKEWDNKTGWIGPDVFRILQDCGLNSLKIRCSVDTSSLSHEDVGVTKKLWHQIQNRSSYGSSLNLNQYMALRDRLSEPDFVYTEGANGVKFNPSIDLQSWAYVFGFYIGDGWTDGNNICFAVENDRVDDFVKILRDLPGINWCPRLRPMLGNSTEVKVSSAIVAAIFRYFFGKSRCWEKRIPGDWIVSWSDVARRALLQGIQDSDGHLNHSRHYITTVSQMLARDILSLLRSLGVSGSIHLRKPGSGGLVRGRKIIGKRMLHVVHYSDNALNGENKGRKGIRFHFAHDGSTFTEARVRAISDEVSISDWVYDLEMEGHPSFVANGLLVHNSATPWREDNQEIRIEGTLGKKLFDISASDLIELGYLVPPTIFMIRVNHLEHAEDYADAYNKHITRCWERNWRIKQCAESFKEAGRPVLILVERREHGEILESMIKDAVFVPGGDKGEDDPTDEERNYRRRMLNRVEANDIILIATQWANVGVDAPAVSTLILAGSSQSSVTTYQQIGRVLRCLGKNAQESAENGKPDAIVIDFMDEHKAMRKHSMKRKKVYQRERAFKYKPVT